MLQRPIRPVAACLLLLLGSCASTEFRNVRTVEKGYDRGMDANVVQVSFELWQDGLPVQGLTAEDFRIYEDGVQATSESLQVLNRQVILHPVTLLLDASYSMYRADAVAPLVAATTDFVRDLESAGFEVNLLAFDADVRAIDSPSDISTSWDDGAGRSRWTALYHALKTALEWYPDSVVVLFSDGADNYSQNHGVTSFEQLREALGGARIHTVGFGNARNERDREGNRATTVLHRLATGGSYRFADDESELRDAFERVGGDIGRQSLNVYDVDYFSPNRQGVHELVVTYRGATTEPLTFRSEGP